MVPFLRETDEGVELALLVQPRASRTRVLGEHDGRLKIAVASPPVDGAANEALTDFLAELLGVNRRAVELEQGASGRRKRVRVSGVAASHVRQMIDEASP